MSRSRRSSEAGQYKAMGSRARLENGRKRKEGGEAAVLGSKGVWARCEMGLCVGGETKRHGQEVGVR